MWHNGIVLVIHVSKPPEAEGVCTIIYKQNYALKMQAVFVRPRASAHNMLLCFKRLVGGPAPADIVNTIINHKSTQNTSCIGLVHSDSARDVICNGLESGDSLTRQVALLLQRGRAMLRVCQ